jgi:Phospholipase C
VLMLENRSYDNIFGWSDIRGWTPDGSPTQAEGLLGKPEFVNRDRRGIPYTVGVGASFQLTFDPGHEFSDVLLQLCGPTSVSAANCLADSANLYSDEYPPIRASANDFGFAACLDDHGYDVAAALRCFTPDQLPVLNFLAHQFAVCDHWFSSMPGPTWPNRFFSLAGTSWGLDHSPSDLSALTSNFLNSERFGNGSDSILTRLAPSEWMVVAGDHAQSWALAGVEKYPHNFVAYSSFSQLLNEKSGFLPRYVFVEPAYDALPMSSFRKGNSMHPLGDVRLGEMLIKEVYETLKASAYWEESALLVLFDEHGGFFDHVIPGKCASPMPQGPRDDLTKHNFGFNQCGFRVPALVISPYVRQSTIDHTVYDHSSILKTAGALLRPPPAQPLITNSRISAANSFEKLFSLTVPRHRDDIPPCPPAVPIPNGSLPSTGRTGRSVDAFQTLPVYRGAA